jgi:hypothetical protein
MGAEPNLTTNDVTALHDFYKSYFTGLQTASQFIEPVMKGMARWQLEVFGLANRRARAYAELPARLTQCRTPQDLANESAAFWQSAVDQYRDSAARLTDAIVPMWTQLPGSEPAQARREHEYIVVPGAEQKPAAEMPAGAAAAAAASAAAQKRRVA